MLLIRTGKVMFVPATAIAMLILILMLLTMTTEVVAGKPIPDYELATLYGGWWFYNPYCGVYGESCPESVPQDCEPLDLCSFCRPNVGLKCFDAYSWLPDLGGCDDGSKPCENAGWAPGLIPCGYCGPGSWCNEDYDPTKDYPDCGLVEYNWCDD